LFSFPAAIGLGSYSVSTALHVSDTHLAANYEWRDLALMFNVVNLDRDPFVGVNWMPPSVEVLR
jgi:lipopolysaccharide transport system ATP-binding protein